MSYRRHLVISLLMLVAAGLSTAASQARSTSNGDQTAATRYRTPLVAPISGLNAPVDDGQRVFLERVGRIGGTVSSVAVSNAFAYIGEGSDLTVLDLSGSARLHPIARLALPGGVQTIQVVDDLAYVTVGERGVAVVDIHEPLHPRLRTTIETSGAANNVRVVEQLAYIATANGLEIVDVADLDHPWLRGAYPFPLGGTGLWVVGKLAIIAEAFHNVRILDVTDPAHPVQRSEFYTDGTPTDITVVESRAYVAVAGIASFSDYGGLQVMDISDPDHPAFQGTLYFGYGDALGVDVRDGFAFVANGAAGLRIVDVRDPDHLKIVGQYPTVGGASDVVVVGDSAFIADASAGVYIVDVHSVTNPLLSRRYRTPGYIQRVNVIDQHAYVVGSELQIIDVSMPSDLRVEGGIALAHTSVGLHVTGSLAYVAVSYAGVQIIDVSNPANPTLKTTFDHSVDARDITVVDRRAYISDAEEGLQVSDVSNLDSPTLLGSYRTIGGIYSSDVVSDTLFAAGTGELRIVDVSNSSSPKLIGHYTNVRDGISFALARVQVVDNLAYLADGSDRLHIVDITNLAAPVARAVFQLADRATDVQVVGSTAYVAATAAGVQILDVRDPAQPILRGAVRTSDLAMGISVAGDLVFVADSQGGLQVFRVYPRESVLYLPR